MQPHHPAHRPDPYQAVLRWYTTAQVNAFTRPARHAHSPHPPRPRRPRESVRGRDEGIVSVESIGWIGIAIAVVAVIGVIVRAKLTAMANSLPDRLGW